MVPLASRMVRYATPGLTGPASSRWAPDPATCKVTGSEPPGLVSSRPVAGKPAAVATGSGPPTSRTVQGLPSAVPEPMAPLRAMGPSLAIVSCRVSDRRSEPIASTCPNCELTREWSELSAPVVATIESAGT